MDALPILSQVKSLVQSIAGDNEGALQTQENFSRQCPIVSQIRSAVEAISGDTEAAERTQLEFVSSLSNAVDAVPVVGHVKGTIHYIAGDKKGGDAAMKSSSRTTGVVAAGAGGFLLGGPVGAVAAGIGAGTAMDGIITGVDSAVHQEFRPYGHLEIVTDPKNPGKWCDIIGGVAFDGITGAASGSLVKSLKKGAPGAAVVLEEAETQGARNIGISEAAAQVLTSITVDEIVKTFVTLCGRDSQKIIKEAIMGLKDCHKSIKATAKDSSKPNWVKAGEIIDQVIHMLTNLYDCAKSINAAWLSKKVCNSSEKIKEKVMATLEHVRDLAKLVCKSITTGSLGDETIAKTEDTVNIVSDCVKFVRSKKE